MRKLIIFLLIGACFACKKDTTTTDKKTTVTGYDRTTERGKLLSSLAVGSNKKLTKVTYQYFNASNTSLGIFNQSVPPNTYLLFGDGLTINPNYLASATTSGNGPINDNTLSMVQIENGVNYLYYQPDKHATPITSPSNTIKIAFSLSNDFKTLELAFTDAGPATAIEGATLISYNKRIRAYTYVGL